MNEMNWDDLVFSVEPMQEADVPTVAAIERSIFSLPWSSSAYTYELRSNPSSRYLVARHRSLPRATPGQEVDPSIIGYGGFWMMLDEAHICTIGVQPGWRRLGAGELLLSSMIREAMHLNAIVVTLEVRVSNVAAQRLYEKYGFQAAGIRKGYYSDNHEDALIMTTETITSPSYQSRFNRLQRLLYQRLLLQQPVEGS